MDLCDEEDGRAYDYLHRAARGDLPAEDESSEEDDDTELDDESESD